MSKAGRDAPRAHSGNTLTARQKEWVSKLRAAATQRPRSKAAAARYLGVNIGTFEKWVWFFSQSRNWPIVIDPKFDRMRVEAHDGRHREDKPDLATPEQCQQLLQQVADWMLKMGQSYLDLARLACVPETQIQSLMSNHTMSAYSASILSRALRGRKVWIPIALSDAEIERRKEAVERERREREAALLEQERTRYNLIRQWKPLSRMVV